MTHNCKIAYFWLSFVLELLSLQFLLNVFKIGDLFTRYKTEYQILRFRRKLNCILLWHCFHVRIEGRFYKTIRFKNAYKILLLLNIFDVFRRNFGVNLVIFLNMSGWNLHSSTDVDLFSDLKTVHICLFIIWG